MTILNRRNLSFHLLVLIPLLSHASGCRVADAAPVACAGPVDVRSQEDVDALAGCQTIDGDLRLSGPAVADTRGLEGLTSVRYLVVVGTSLEDLSGLAGLRDVRGITIAQNAGLVSLHGLEGVGRLEGLVVEGNDALASLAGLEAAGRSGEVSIASNPRLLQIAAR